MINRVVLLGRLVRDPDVSKTQSGLSVCSFTVACDRRSSKDQEGEKVADFISCVAWRQDADFLDRYGHKGAVVAVDGRIQTRSYVNRDGYTVYVTEVVADSVKLPEGRKDTGKTYDYGPQMGVSKHLEDFDTGSVHAGITNDDLPF